MKDRVLIKIKTFFRVISFFYIKFTKDTLLRDILLIVNITADMLSITVAGKFIDATVYIIKGWTTFNVSDYFITDSFYYLSLILFLLLISSIASRVRDSIMENISDRVWKETNISMLDKIAKSNLQDIEQSHMQQLLDFIPNYSISNLLLSYQAFSDIMSYGVRLVSAFAIMYMDLGWSVLFLILIALPEVILSHLGRRKLRKYDNDEMDSLKLTNYIYNTLGMDIKSFPELRVDGTYPFLQDTFVRAREKYLKGLFFRRKHFWIDKTFGSVIDQLLKFGYIVYILAYSIKNRLSIGSFSALYNYADVVFSSSFNMLNTLSMLDNYVFYAYKYFEFIDFEGFGDIQHGDKKLEEGTPSLEFHNLDFSYPDEPNRKVLENICISIKAGEKVAFLGEDGSGKSSLIKVFSGLYEIIAGDYVIDGLSIRELDRGELKKKISVTFQNFINYNFSIEKNITMASGRKKIDRPLYERVLRICGLDKFMLKQGLHDNQILGKYLDGKELSPGYWQRLAIARMLYRNRQIFIMDEPFTFIDTQSKGRLLDEIFKFIGKRRTLIYITRSTENLDMFDRIYYIYKGHIVESGSWRDLLKKKGVVYKKSLKN